MPEPDPDAEWWTVADVAAYLGIKSQTVSTYRTRGEMPDADRQIGRTRVWRPRTIIDWHTSRPRRGRSS